MISAQDVADLYRERKQGRSLILRRGQEIKQAYNAELAVPVTELPAYSNRDERAAVANLIQLGIDQTAMRIASTMPTLYSPPLRPGIKQSEDRAERRRKAAYGWWYDNDFEIKQGRRARHLIAYSQAPVLIRPWPKKSIPLWRTFDPLCTFPAAMPDEGSMEPDDCIFAFRKTLGWLRRAYPGPTSVLFKGEAKNSDLFDVLEYTDADETVLVAVGRDRSAMYDPTGDLIFGTERAVELERLPNRTGMCLAVVPGRVTLDRPVGQFDGAIGTFIKQARLAALEEIAIERGVFPEQWLVSDGNVNAEIITPADPAMAIIGETRGGKIETVAYQPGYKTTDAIDRNERYIRVDGRIPADYTGESASNVRTDRRGNSILAATVDFTIGEAQKVLARSHEKELVRAVAVAKTSFGSQRKVFYVGWDRSQVDYTPDTDFDSDVIFVRYSMPGTDVNGLALAGGQRIGMGTMDPLTFMELDPMVDDPRQVQERIVADQLDKSILAEILQPGSMPVADKARVRELVLAGTDLSEAIAKAQAEAQARQSSTVAPAQPGSPESQPGLSPAGMGAEAGVAAPAGPSTADLSTRLRALARVGTQPHTTDVPTSGAAA